MYDYIILFFVVEVFPAVVFQVHNICLMDIIMNSDLKKDPDSDLFKVFDEVYTNLIVQKLIHSEISKKHSDKRIFDFSQFFASMNVSKVIC